MLWDPADTMSFLTVLSLTRSTFLEMVSKEHSFKILPLPRGLELNQPQLFFLSAPGLSSLVDYYSASSSILISSALAIG